MGDAARARGAEQDRPGGRSGTGYVGGRQQLRGHALSGRSGAPIVPEWRSLYGCHTGFATLAHRAIKQRVSPPGRTGATTGHVRAWAPRWIR